MPDLDVKSLVQHLGALIYPKDMLKYYQQNAKEQRAQTIQIYHYLYKFSLQRLQCFIENKALIFLFAYYVAMNGNKRIMKSQNMLKHRDAYVEAAQVMIRES